ncbi:FxsA family protein [Nonomuraea sp. MG754425]|uniref:FxsA family protein n=1 Tax=Nonomuraea sp. MG754425 TaxID=2570319 RepID=UPI001F3B9481|nr:FxsA family protein [Nonomuraea sp. MG754425]MCF6476120.1 FxsA family protein [Nonomuraea sp. MG754425]
MRLLLFLAFLLVPVLEIWLLIQVGSVIGGPLTVALLIAGVLLGGWLVRREGRRVWQALQSAVQTGRMPDRELADGGVIMVGGVLLMVPGLVSDVVGLLCLMPFTRPMMRRLGSRFFERRMERMAARSPYANLYPPSSGAPGADPGANVPQGGRVVHGEVIREERDS